MAESRIKTVVDIMTKEVVSVSPAAFLFDAVKLMEEKSINGLPVVEKENKLVGIITEYDLINNAAHVHLPTLQKIFQNLNIVDSKEMEQEKKKITSLTVRDVMNQEPLTLRETASLGEAVALFKEHHRVNPVPVVDATNTVVGIISRYDIIKLLHFDE